MKESRAPSAPVNSVSHSPFIARAWRAWALMEVLMSEMVKRVASAIAVALAKDPVAYSGYYDDAATAAIAAMQEPSKEINESADGTQDGAPRNALPRHAAGYWVGEVNAAVKSEVLS